MTSHLAGGSAAPTGIPEDATEATDAINAVLGSRLNLPADGLFGILHASGQGDQLSTAAQVSIALSLADIAKSLRVLTGRPGAAQWTD